MRHHDGAYPHETTISRAEPAGEKQQKNAFHGLEGVAGHGSQTVAKIPFTTLPFTSVSRMSRPA